jgi:dTDP-4-dehydrorhamnose 3,5-epimerase
VRAVPTAVADCRELLLDPSGDRRGGFLKVFNTSAFAGLGIDFAVHEIFVSRSRRDVIRGLHFQRPPADVAKLVVCLEGAVFDAVVDLRVGSPTYRQHCTVALSSDTANAMYVPPGCAHGFQVVSEDSLVAYAQSGEHDAVLEGGVLWSSAGVDWPVSTPVLSDRDATFTRLDDFESPFRYGEG